MLTGDDLRVHLSASQRTASSSSQLKMRGAVISAPCSLNRGSLGLPSCAAGVDSYSRTALRWWFVDGWSRCRFGSGSSGTVTRPAGAPQQRLGRLQTVRGCGARRRGRRTKWGCLGRH